VARQWVAQTRGWGRSLLAKCASPMGSTEPEGRSLVVEVARHWVAPNRRLSLLFKVTHQRVAPNRGAESAVQSDSPTGSTEPKSGVYW